MSLADTVFLANCAEILESGVWDTDREVRPRWEDGAPAHTVKRFGIVNRYDQRRHPASRRILTSLYPAVTDFYAFTPESFSLEDYRPHPFEERIPVAV